MCGIAGQYTLGPTVRRTPQAVFDEALRRLDHRGPDSKGQWRSNDGRFWLGHARLATAHPTHRYQPMLTPDTRFCVSFDGTIDNSRALRRELDERGFAFRSQHDTEVLLHGYSAWGARGLCERLQGAFAFAIRDAERKRIVLARDHLGAKPLYWWNDGQQLLFASEIKALLAFPAIQASREVNLNGIAQAAVMGHTARPQTMFKGIWRLPEGCYIEFGEEQQRRTPAPVRYWDSSFEPDAVDPGDAAAELDSRIKAIVDAQMRPGATMGVQLSGDAGSYLVAATMAAIHHERGSSEPIQSFSVSFEDGKHSELGIARSLADRFGTEHHHLMLNAPDALAGLVLNAWRHDEPVSAPSVLSASLLSFAARSAGVAVLLTADGADEVFGSHEAHSQRLFASRLQRWTGGIGNVAFGAATWLMPASGVAAKLKRPLDFASIPNEALRLATWRSGLRTSDQRRLLSPALHSAVGDGALQAAFSSVLQDAPRSDQLARLLYADRHTHLADRVLLEGDRTTMAAGLEARSPFLDWTLVAFADRLPSTLKLHRDRRKSLLMSLAKPYLRAPIGAASKVRSAAPMQALMRRSLAPLLRETLLSERALSRGYFNADAVRAAMSQNQSSLAHHDAVLWRLMAIEVWHRLFIDEDGSLAAARRVSAEIAAATVSSALRLDPGALPQPHSETVYA